MRVLRVEKINSGIVIVLNGYSPESELYFYGEQEVVPLSIKIEDEYMHIKGDNITLTVNERLFRDKIIEYDFELYLYDMNHRTKCKVEAAEEYKYTISGSLLYDYEICIQGIQLVVKVRKKPYKFRVNEIVTVDDKRDTLTFEANDLLNKKLVLAKRVTEKLWRYRDDFIELGVLEDNEITYNVPFESIISDDAETSFYDYLLEVVKGKQKAHYFIDANFEGALGEKILEHVSPRGTIGVYKSGGNHLTLRGKTQYEKAELLEYFADEKKVRLKISCMDDTDNVSLLFKRRTYSGKSRYFCSGCEFLCEKQGEYIFFERDMSDFIGTYIQGKDEHWEVFLKGKNLYEIHTNGLVNTKYYPVGEYQMTFFDNTGKLAIYTHDGSHSSNSKIRIGVVGTCFTRSVFKSQPYFNPDYKRFYNCCFTQFHSSLISLGCMERIDEGLLNQICMDKEAALYFPTEFKKDFFEKLEKANLSYLVIDNYIDATRPIIEIEPGTYLTLNKYVSNQKITKFIGQAWRVIKPGTKEHAILYEKYAKIFINKVKEYIPENHIILVQGRFSTKKINEKTGEITEWNGKEYIQKNNFRWDKVDAVLRRIAPSMRVIDMRSTRYVSDINSPIPGGASPSHYQKYYYKEVLDGINKIVLEDVLNSR